MTNFLLALPCQPVVCGAGERAWLRGRNTAPDEVADQVDEQAVGHRVPSEVLKDAKMSEHEAARPKTTHEDVVSPPG